MSQGVLGLININAFIDARYGSRSEATAAAECQYALFVGQWRRQRSQTVQTLIDARVLIHPLSFFLFAFPLHAYITCTCSPPLFSSRRPTRNQTTCTSSFRVCTSFRLSVVRTSIGYEICQTNRTSLNESHRFSNSRSDANIMMERSM